MKRLRKDAIDWLFNQSDARKAIHVLGARNLTVIEATFISTGHPQKNILDDGMRQEVVASYTDMVMFDGKEADNKVVEWMKNQISSYKSDPRYLYFRFIRKN